jgi:hypothetical protein
MNVAAGIVEAKDDVAVSHNLLEALEAAHCLNRSDFHDWHIHHESAERRSQGRSHFLRSSALAA